MLSWEAEIAKIRQIRAKPKDSDQNAFKRLENIRVLVIIGSKDPIIPLADAKAVYEHIPGTNKKLIEEAEMGHGVFSHGIIKNKIVEHLHGFY